MKYCQCRLIRYCDSECQRRGRESHRGECMDEMERRAQREYMLSRAGGMQKEGTGRMGLYNSGNTCYLNSVLQALASASDLSHYYLSNQFINHLHLDNPLGSAGHVSVEYSRLLKSLLVDDQGSAVDAEDIKAALERVAPQFEGYEQHDSQEIMNYLLDMLHEDSNCSQVDHLLRGTLTNHIRCKLCQG